MNIPLLFTLFHMLFWPNITH